MWPKFEWGQIIGWPLSQISSGAMAPCPPPPPPISPPMARVLLYSTLLQVQHVGVLMGMPVQDMKCTR